MKRLLENLPENSTQILLHEVSLDILRKHKPDKQHPVHPIKVTFADVETTGVTHGKDKVTQLGLLQILFCGESGLPHQILNWYEGFNDPGIPIPEDVQRLTGITDEMVKGQVLDTMEIGNIISDSDLIVAHKADFDRPFVDDICPVSRTVPWSCSLMQIDWKKEECECARLSHICLEHGFFYKGKHSALSDCVGLAWLMCHRSIHKQKLTYMKILLWQLNNGGIVFVQALGAPFEKKDVLKGMGFQWNPADKVWERKMPFYLWREVQHALRELVYFAPDVPAKYKYQSENPWCVRIIDAKDAFKSSFY